MAQDDAHIFCEPDQLSAEVERTLEMVQEVYRDFGLSRAEVSVATRPELYAGSASDWERAEALLVGAVRRAGFECEIQAGEGAFYGPKIQCDFRDALGRAWQLSTVQLDVAMPERFDLCYVGSDGHEHRPAMLHRAILGTLERFLGIYLEHTAGELPLWLAPVQVVVLPVADRHARYAWEVCLALRERGVDAEMDARSERLGYRVRAGETQKIPYLLVVGDREAAEQSVNVRRRHEKGQETVSLKEFGVRIQEEMKASGIS